MGRRLAALLLFTLPLVAQLPPGVTRVPFGDMRDASFFAATSDDTFWMASLFDNDLQRFDFAGGKIFDLPPIWSGTRSIAIGPDGALWLGGVAWVARVDPATNAIQRWAQGTGVSTDGILSGPDGNVWLIQGHRVARVRPDGRFLWNYYVGPTTGSAFGTDGALYLAAANRLVRITAAGEQTSLPASPRLSLYAGAGFFWSGGYSGEIVKLSDRGETLATYNIAMRPMSSDALGNLWLRGSTDEGEVVGQLTPFGVLTRFGPLPAIPSTNCSPRWFAVPFVFLSDGRVAMADYYPDLPHSGPCIGVPKPAEFQNVVTILDPRIAPVLSVQSLDAVRRRGARH